MLRSTLFHTDLLLHASIQNLLQKLPRCTVEELATWRRTGDDSPPTHTTQTEVQLAPRPNYKREHFTTHSGRKRCPFNFHALFATHLPRYQSSPTKTNDPCPKIQGTSASPVTACRKKNGPNTSPSTVHCSLSPRRCSARRCCEARILDNDGTVACIFLLRTFEGLEEKAVGEGKWEGFDGQHVHYSPAFRHPPTMARGNRKSRKQPKGLLVGAQTNPHLSTILL